MIFFRVSLYGIVGAMLAGGFALAVEGQKKTPLPKNRPAVVTPQGGISFGETTSQTPAQQRRFLLKYQEMTQKEIDDLTAALKIRSDKAPVMIVCKDPLCEDLALNLDNAFESARWKSEIIIGTQFGVPAGVSVSSKWLAGLLNSVTANRYDAKIEEGPSAVQCVADMTSGRLSKCPDTEYILIGAKPR